MKTKQELRKDYRAIRNSISQANQEYNNICIYKRVFELIHNDHEQVICGYIAHWGEVNLNMLYTHIIDIHKLLFPRWTDDGYQFAYTKKLTDLIPGKYGILEPPHSAPLLHIKEIQETATMWLIPMMSFDRTGTRLGYGGGYYDRFLKEAKGLKVGVAFSCQEHDALPYEDHDVPMDWILTEKEAICVKDS